MFDATSENFFSYVIVFRLEGEPEITADLLASELLAYFRGLSRTTAPEKEKFEVQLKATAQSPEGANTFEGTARWIETFRTQDWQTLQIEARSWKDADAKTWVFLSISPQEDKDAAIWKEMSGIRDRFLEQD